MSRLSEPSAACLMCSGRLFEARQTFHAPGIEIRTKVKSEFRRDHDLFAERGQGFAHEFLVRERAIDFGGIEKCDATFHCGPNQRRHLLLVFGRTI